VRLDGLQMAEAFWLGFFLSRNCGFDFSSSRPYREKAGCSPSYLFYLDALLSPNEDIPHLSDVILHQIYVEGISDLQPADESGGDYVLIIVVY